jgi:hypothetical protein
MHNKEHRDDRDAGSSDHAGRRGDVFGMAEAILRLLTMPTAREGMAERARELMLRPRGTSQNNTATNDE